MDTFLYIIMVGLPARGKSTLAWKLYESLKRDNIKVRIFNNGYLRRKLSRENTSYPEFFNPKNKTSAALREKYAIMNLRRAKNFIHKEITKKRVAIIDATNVSFERRKKIISFLGESNILFIECINNDQEILEENIRLKTHIPEFSHITESEAIYSLKKRIEYYETIYNPLQNEPNFIKIDTFNYKIIQYKVNDDLPFIDRVRDFIVTPFIKNLYLLRHTESVYNLYDKIGGDSELTPKGIEDAQKIAKYFSNKKIPLIFTSSLKRTIQLAQIIKQYQKNCQIISFNEFNEINAGVCENMTYSEIRKTFPEIDRARKTNKYFYVYPQGEGYVSMEERIERGIKKVIYLSKHLDNIMIIGHRAVNRMILSYFVYKRQEDIPYIYVPIDRYYHITINQNKKIFELKSLNL
jgi:broad specificity phosphatase PhoE/predicted kinase